MGIDSQAMKLIYNKIYSLLSTIPVWVIACLSVNVVYASTDPVSVGIYQNPPKLFMDKSGNASGFFPEVIRKQTPFFFFHRLSILK